MKYLCNLGKQCLGDEAVDQSIQITCIRLAEAVTADLGPDARLRVAVIAAVREASTSNAPSIFAQLSDIADSSLQSRQAMLHKVAEDTLGATRFESLMSGEEQQRWGAQLIERVDEDTSASCLTSKLVSAIQIHVGGYVLDHGIQALVTEFETVSNDRGIQHITSLCVL